MLLWSYNFEIAEIICNFEHRMHLYCCAMM